MHAGQQQIGRNLLNAFLEIGAGIATVGNVDQPAIQRGIHLTRRQRRYGHTEIGHHGGRQPHEAALQPRQIGDAADFDARVNRLLTIGGGGDIGQPGGRIAALRHLQPAAVIEPRFELVTLRKAERHGRGKAVRRNAPGGVAVKGFHHLERTAAHRVKRLRRRHDLPAREGADLQGAA